MTMPSTSKTTSSSNSARHSATPIADENAFLNGNGTHKPKSLLTLTKTSVTTVAADLEADELVTLVYSLKRPYRKNAAFIVNRGDLYGSGKIR